MVARQERGRDLTSLEKYQEAMQRVKTIREIFERGVNPAALTKIEILDPVFPEHLWLSRIALGPGRRRGITWSEYGFGEPMHDRYAVRHRLDPIETTKGVVLPFTYAGNEIYTKWIQETDPDRRYDLIVALDGTGRSWMGGTEKADGLSYVGAYNQPRTIGTTNRGMTGHFGDRAIENWTNPNKMERFNPVVETEKLCNIGNGLIEVGGPGVHTAIANIDPYLLPENFQPLYVSPVPTHRPVIQVP